MCGAAAPCGNPGAVLKIEGFIPWATRSTPVGDVIYCTLVLPAVISPPAVSDVAEMDCPAVIVVPAVIAPPIIPPPTLRDVPAVISPSQRLPVIEIAPAAFTFPRAKPSVNVIEFAVISPPDIRLSPAPQ